MRIYLDNCALNRPFDDQTSIWAEELSKKGLGAKDALHVACARKADCAYFITTDRRILKEAAFGSLKIRDPVSFLTDEEAPI